MLKKKIWANFQRIKELFTQKIVTMLHSKIWVWDPGSEIGDPEKTYSGSRIQGSKRHRIPDPRSRSATLVHWFHYSSCTVLIRQLKTEFSCVRSQALLVWNLNLYRKEIWLVCDWHKLILTMIFMIFKIQNHKYQAQIFKKISLATNISSKSRDDTNSKIVTQCCGSGSGFVGSLCF